MSAVSLQGRARSTQHKMPAYQRTPRSRRLEGCAGFRTPNSGGGLRLRGVCRRFFGGSMACDLQVGLGLRPGFGQQPDAAPEPALEQQAPEPVRLGGPHPRRGPSKVVTVGHQNLVASTFRLKRLPNLKTVYDICISFATISCVNIVAISPPSSRWNGTAPIGTASRSGTNTGANRCKNGCLWLQTAVVHSSRRELSRAAAPTVQGDSAPESHQGTPIWSPLTPHRETIPAVQPEPDWVCVSASPAGAALQAPVSTVPTPHPSTSTRASLASSRVR